MSATTTNELHTAVEDLIEHMKTGKILEGFDTYYGDDVAMQENSGEPTVGKAANRVREEQFLASVKEWNSLNVTAAATHGDLADGVAFIEYDFDFINTDDQPVRYEQVSVQTWKNGKIARERFYYNAGG